MAGLKFKTKRPLGVNSGYLAFVYKSTQHNVCIYSNLKVTRETRNDNVIESISTFALLGPVWKLKLFECLHETSLRTFCPHITLWACVNMWGMYFVKPQTGLKIIYVYITKILYLSKFVPVWRYSFRFSCLNDLWPVWALFHAGLM